MEFKGKKVLVCGLARSGQSAARLLAQLGAKVVAQDLKEEVAWNFTTPEEMGIELLLGKNPDDIVESFDLVVISPGIPFDLPFLEKARLKNIPVWGEVELAYRRCPCPIIAITGTNGKTTVTTLVGEILQRHNHQTVVVGNIGIPFTEHVEFLEPDNCVVAEISSFQLETTYEFAPKISAVLNITPDHLDRHKTMAIYQATKERIFANQSPDDFVILGYDNAACRGMTPPSNKIYFSTKEKLDTGVFLDNGMIRAKLFDKDLSIVEINQCRILPENALAATAICLCAGVPPISIAESLVGFKGVSHRIEYVTTINGVEFFNDSKATNTDSAIKGLEAMQRPVILIGGGYDKKSTFGDWVRYFNDKVKHLIVLGEVSDQIVETCRAYGFNQYDQVNSLRDAVQLAYAKAKPGDCVLLSPACASWDMFDNFEQRGDLFKQFVFEITPPAHT
ncbi:MAG: UDP-N-acetylmuramoyl-L-alanine--D-glutamate ligase [Defluviitaleaceae bacterium]|nr:UDP-N-acetylmuramoyl-L-alanine--D-glutamate ligase [Defluviitaleaceae bacterium]